jgi:hypothetical protein
MILTSADGGIGGSGLSRYATKIRSHATKNRESRHFVVGRWATHLGENVAESKPKHFATDLACGLLHESETAAARVRSTRLDTKVAISDLTQLALGQCLHTLCALN